ncbi:HlyD family type I secretion periplasmic adaptor subunit [Sphingomonas sp. CFBP 8764]|uniref:HlyD family type I secretion periplasmic adaptor subunit n=1 Tax=Sphingomonas sp. CFBP 8764 TaxID=2775275 RepID=UPI00177C1F7C|nr:HlyD family type I secretion periplasmic adaptor subunit [Sphingomonas sp. CFBP 8764]MBD8552074.1 HlyD family type I secretion periplasmic adaptor subunit [Sphingomonas sp. CFBP 8764]
MSDMVSQPIAAFASPPPSMDDSLAREWKVGGGIAVAFFVGFIGWAALTPLDSGALATGVVAVSGSRQAVQHRDGGIVTALRVIEGQLVAKGQPLLIISASELVASERGLTGEIFALVAQRERLLAERGGLARMREPPEFATLTNQDRMLANGVLNDQRLLFDARRNALQTERGVLGERAKQYAQQIGGYHHQMGSNREQLRLINQELVGLKTLVPKGFVSLNRVLAMQRTAAELDGNHGSYQAEAARSSAAIDETRMQIVALDKQRLEEGANQMRDVQVRLDDLRPKLFATREQIARSTVRAPASGRVVALKIFTIGGVVSPGQTLMEIVPQDRALVVEGKALPTDADDLRIGMKTQVRFSALQDRKMPILYGRLSKVSADSFEDERTGSQYFKIEVIVPPNEFIQNGYNDSSNILRAGLPAEIMVPLRKRTALAYLIEPLTHTLWRAGREQ